MGRRYADAVRAVADVEAVLEGNNNGGRASERARDLTGLDDMGAQAKTVDVLRRAVSERYETAVWNSDVAGLSELMPLIGMLDMAKLSVRLGCRSSRNMRGCAFLQANIFKINVAGQFAPRELPCCSVTGFFTMGTTV